jgi:hypothetical protein
LRISRLEFGHRRSALGDGKGITLFGHDGLQAQSDLAAIFATNQHCHVKT